MPPAERDLVRRVPMPQKPGRGLSAPQAVQLGFLAFSAVPGDLREERGAAEPDKEAP